MRLPALPDLPQTPTGHPRACSSCRSHACIYEGISREASNARLNQPAGRGHGSKTAAPRRGNITDGLAQGIVWMFGCPREEQCSGRGYEMIYPSRTRPGSRITVGLTHALTHCTASVILLPECRCGLAAACCRTVLRAHGKRCHHSRTDTSTEAHTGTTVSSQSPTGGGVQT